MRMHRWLLVGTASAVLLAAGTGCSSSKDTAPTAAPSGAGGTTVTTPAVKTPGTTASTENGTTVRPATSAPATKPTAPNQVRIADFLFAPTPLEVKAGTEVVWANQDEFDHWVLADDKTSFDSGTMAQGATYPHTFATAGTYTYFCNIHNQMKGTIVVS